MYECDVYYLRFTWFSQERILLTHTRTHKTSDTMYECDVCSMSMMLSTFYIFELSQVRILLTHTRTHRQSDTMYECDECCQRLNKKKIVLTHSGTHTDTTERLDVMHVVNLLVNFSRYKKKMFTHTLTRTHRHSDTGSPRYSDTPATCPKHIVIQKPPHIKK